MAFSLLLFLIGILGFILNRKNIILLLISLEIMLLAITLLFLITSYSFDDNLGQTFGIYIIYTHKTSDGLNTLNKNVIYLENFSES